MTFGNQSYGDFHIGIQYMLIVNAIHCLYKEFIKMHYCKAMDLSVINAKNAESEAVAFLWTFKDITSDKFIGWSGHDIKHV